MNQKAPQGHTFSPVEIDRSVRNDFQTPEPVCEYMSSLIPSEFKTVLEPTPGQGNLVQAALNRGFDVTAPDDYFLLDPDKRFDCVLMNPPFSRKYGFNVPDHLPEGLRFGFFLLTECMNKADCVVALMPWFTISDSDVRLKFLRDYGLKSVTALPRKTFRYSRIQTCVLELQKGFNSTTHFKIFEY